MSSICMKNRIAWKRQGGAMAQIEVEHLSKTFRLYKHKTGFKGMMTNFFHRQYEYKEAVKDISFSIEQGEFVGFLGIQRKPSCQSIVNDVISGL